MAGWGLPAFVKDRSPKTWQRLARAIVDDAATHFTYGGCDYLVKEDFIHAEDFGNEDRLKPVHVEKVAGAPRESCRDAGATDSTGPQIQAGREAAHRRAASTRPPQRLLCVPGIQQNGWGARPLSQSRSRPSQAHLPGSPLRLRQVVHQASLRSRLSSCACASRTKQCPEQPRRSDNSRSAPSLALRVPGPHLRE